MYIKNICMHNGCTFLFVKVLLSVLCQDIEIMRNVYEIVKLLEPSCTNCVETLNEFVDTIDAT